MISRRAVFTLLSLRPFSVLSALKLLNVDSARGQSSSYNPTWPKAESKQIKASMRFELFIATRYLRAKRR
ncbi:MAG: hypothetical protein WAK27_07790, partial [Candidatus Sulfotelmatobacter sp.]